MLKELLYSDIINLRLPGKNTNKFRVLSKLTKTYEVKDLLCNILKDDKIKQEGARPDSSGSNRLSVKISERQPERTITGRKCRKSFPAY